MTVWRHGGGVDDERWRHGGGLNWHPHAEVFQSAFASQRLPHREVKLDWMLLDDTTKRGDPLAYAHEPSCLGCFEVSGGHKPGVT